MEDHNNREWMNCDRLSKEYLEGVKKFIDHAFKNKDDGGKILCPCQQCVLQSFVDRGQAYDHLVVYGIIPSYDTWFCHGESIAESRPRQEMVGQDASSGDDMVGMLHDAFRGVPQAMDTEIDANNLEEPMLEGTNPLPSENDHPEVENFKRLMKDADEELYSGCEKFTKLSFLLQLYQLKCLFGWSNTSFDSLLGLLKKAFPKGVKLPNCYKETKKIIEGLGLKYEKIHACPNDCMLFRKEKAKDDACSICGASRWKHNGSGTESGTTTKTKRNKIAAKVLRYFPLVPRLQRLFMSSKTSDLMRWHDKERNKDTILRHPADSEAWKTFDLHNAEFAKDPRNVRLGLASDGFNPYGTMQSVYSTWPVILMPYNLPPWLCMKKSSFILSLLIPGPKGPGNSIDVYLEPLIEELIELWEVGVETYDASTNEKFQMRAAIMWTINDFPAYGTLSGWSTFGRFACPTCNINTSSIRLKYGKKFCYLRHRRFLRRGHKYRLDAKSFDGTKEFSFAPPYISGPMVLDQLKDISFTLGENRSVIGVEAHTWRKKSIFFKLPYWKHNVVRHNLDVMHIEKNVCDNLIYTILNVEKKSKDNLGARLDLKEMKIRPELWPQQRASGRTYLPTTSFSLSPHEKRIFYEVLENVKFPLGYHQMLHVVFVNTNYQD